MVRAGLPPVDEVPYVGRLPRGGDDPVASGFDKWGMSNGVAAALALSSRLLGGATSWAPAFESWSPHELKGVFDAAKANASVAVELGKGWLRPKAAAPTVQPGDGRVWSNARACVRWRCAPWTGGRPVCPRCARTSVAS